MDEIKSDGIVCWGNSGEGKEKFDDPRLHILRNFSRKDVKLNIKSSKNDYYFYLLPRIYSKN